MKETKGKAGRTSDVIERDKTYLAEQGKKLGWTDEQIGKVQQAWTNYSQGIDDIFNDGGATCHIGTGKWSGFLRNQKLVDDLRIHSGDFRNAGHWWFEGRVNGKRYIFDFGDNISKEAIKSGHIKPRIISVNSQYAKHYVSEFNMSRLDFIDDMVAQAYPKEAFSYSNFLDDDVIRDWKTLSMEDKKRKIAEMSKLHKTEIDELPDEFINSFDFLTYHDEVTSIFKEYGLTPEYSITYASKPNTVMFKVLDETGNHLFLSRRFHLTDKTVEHVFFELSESLQGKGISKQLFKTYYKQYQNLGIKNIKVHANIDVGGYTWGKYGFSLDGGLDAVLEFTQNYLYEAGDEYIKVLQAIDDFYAVHAKNVNFPMNLMASIPEVKPLLLGSDWIGSLDLTNAVQRSIFENYMGL